MAGRISAAGLADAIMGQLTEYADLVAEDVKDAVKSAGDTVKKEIQKNAPKDTGQYAKSWTVKKVRETSESLVVAVYSRNKYQLAHLLEYGHAKRGGGRVAGQAHIAPAEEIGIRQLEEEIERRMRSE